MRYAIPVARDAIPVARDTIPVARDTIRVARDGGNLRLSGTVDFTLSNARQSYSSIGNPLGLKGLRD